jgi:hypothetical protein
MRRERGAAFIVFGWPSFWWLEHYVEFAAHLRARYECVLTNARLVVFDLRDPAERSQAVVGGHTV